MHSRARNTRRTVLIDYLSFWSLNIQSTLMSYRNYTSSRMVTMVQWRGQKVLVRMWGNQNSHTWLAGVLNGINHLRTSLHLFWVNTNEIDGLYGKNTFYRKLSNYFPKTYRWRFIAAIYNSKILETQISITRWINKQWSIHI